MSVLNEEAHAALDRMDSLARVWALITDLLCPERDLNQVDRDGFATAADFIHSEYQEARRAFDAAIQTITQERAA